MSKSVLLYLERGGQEKGGIKQYSQTVLNTLLKDDGIAKIYVLGGETDTKDHTKLVYIPEYVIRTFDFFNRLYEKLVIICFEAWGSIPTFLSPIRVVRWFYRFDVVYSPSQYIPISSFDSKVTLHDLQEMHLPQNFSSAKLYRRIRRWTVYCELKNLRYICSFNHIKNDLIKYLKIPDDFIDVQFLGIRNHWCVNYSCVTYEENLDSTFLFYPANFWPHKNHFNLIEAIAILSKKNNKIKLLLTGAKTGKEYDLLRNHVNLLGLQNNVKFLGTVSEKELAKLYCESELVVIPTLYEAGSYPVMESIFFNKVPVCSAISAIKETIGDNDVYFDPYSPESIAEKIEYFLYDPNEKIKVLNSLKETREKLLKVVPRISI